MKNCALFFSISSSILFVSIFKGDEKIFDIQTDNFRFHSDNFIDTISSALEKNKLLLSEINEIYFTSTPSSQTGIRISLTFLSTLMFLNHDLTVYHINTLLLQACGDYCLSALSIDSEKTKFFFSIFNNYKSAEKEVIIISRDELEKTITKETATNKEILLKIDFSNVKFLDNFIKIKKRGLFKILRNIEEINY